MFQFEKNISYNKSRNRVLACMVGIHAESVQSNPRRMAGQAENVDHRLYRIIFRRELKDSSNQFRRRDKVPGENIGLTFLLKLPRDIFAVVRKKNMADFVRQRKSDPRCRFGHIVENQNAVFPHGNMCVSALQNISDPSKIRDC